MSRRFEGKLALVTGAGSGIGRATAVALANDGARVVALDVDPARVEAIAAELSSRCALARTVDVGDRGAMGALAGEVHARFGPLDVLVNNAGVGHSGGVLDTSLDDWDWVLRVNLLGVVHGCHFFVPPMAARGSGHVVNVASAFGLFAGPGVAPYCTTKFAVVGLSESMRAELAPRGVGVTAVCPGVIATDIIQRGRFADESMRGRVADAFRRRGHSPDRVARAVLGAIEQDLAVVPVGPEAWFAYLGKRVAPGLAARIGQRVESLTRA
jgi:NAD(P)-dependent dehydrogenase (short-subunit alcohol dehydrogenase family)